MIDNHDHQLDKVKHSGFRAPPKTSIRCPLVRVTSVMVSVGVQKGAMGRFIQHY